MLILNKRSKKVLEDTINIMENQGINQIEFSPFPGSVLLLLKEGTKEAYEKQKEAASILDIVECLGQKFLVCRK
jgi:hypothetical protein